MRPPRRRPQRPRCSRPRFRPRPPMHFRPGPVCRRRGRTTTWRRYSRHLCLEQNDSRYPASSPCAGAQVEEPERVGGAARTRNRHDLIREDAIKYYRLCSPSSPALSQQEGQFSSPEPGCGRRPAAGRRRPVPCTCRTVANHHTGSAATRRDTDSQRGRLSPGGYATSFRGARVGAARTSQRMRTAGTRPRPSRGANPTACDHVTGVTV
jgi:hypothetical protein